MEPEILKGLSFDYCLIAVEAYQEIRKQCLQELMIPESKILIVKNLTEWDNDLLESIFDVNILGNPKRYKVEGVELDLGEGHALPLYQKHYKMYDRFMPYLSEITNKKEGNVIIDIGANVGDSLAAMCQHTNDRFLCIEPVNAFYRLLEENVRRLGMLGRVDFERVFITDKVEETYKAVISTRGTAVKEKINYDEKVIPSKSVDCLIRERALEFKDIDLLKIDTDGYDADCIISAREMLNKGSAIIYWENYISSYEQYEKYLEAYKLLHDEGYVAFFIFDNYGNYLCKGDFDTICSIASYMQRVNTKCIGSTFTYIDVLACKSEDVSLCTYFLGQYLKQYPLHRIHRMSETY